MDDELAKELIHSINAQNHLKEVELELKASVERDKAILTAQSHLNEAIKNDKLNPTIKSKGKIKFYEKELKSLTQMNMPSTSSAFVLFINSIYKHHRYFRKMARRRTRQQREANSK